MLCPVAVSERETAFDFFRLGRERERESARARASILIPGINSRQNDDYKFQADTR